MIYLYAADIRNLPDPKEYPEMLTGLSDERKEKTMRCLQAGDRKRSLGAGLLLNKVLIRHGARPAEIRLRADGKPEAEGVFFNLSHSENIVICATAEKEVGCDVERVVNAPERIAERFFHKDEIEYIRGCGNEEKDERFFRIWTMKESYVKMTGEGIKLPFDSFAILFEPEEVSIYRDGKRVSCHVMEYDIPGYKVAVCAEEEQFAQGVEYVCLGR